MVRLHSRASHGRAPFVAVLSSAGVILPHSAFHLDPLDALCVDLNRAGLRERPFSAVRPVVTPRKISYLHLNTGSRNLPGACGSGLGRCETALAEPNEAHGAACHERRHFRAVVWTVLVFVSGGVGMWHAEVRAACRNATRIAGAGLACGSLSIGGRVHPVARHAAIQRDRRCRARRSRRQS